MSTRRLVVWITFLAVFAMSARISMDTDTWWHLRAGQWIVENRAAPGVDVFSHTRAGELWEYPGWLVEIPMVAIYRVLGPGGLNLWTAAMITLAFYFIWRALAGGVFLRAFVIILAATASGVYWAARPYLVTFVLAAVYLWILEDYRWRRSDRTQRRLWWLPFLMVVWANSHGGFAVGFILWGLYWFSDLLSGLYYAIRNTQYEFRISYFAFRNLKSAIRSPQFTFTLVGLAMILAVCLNPYGPVMLLYPFKTVSIGALQDYIQEWQSPNFHSLSVQPFIWLLLATFAAVGLSRRRLALSDFLLVGVFAYMGLLAGRNVALFALAAALVLARHLAPLSDALARKVGYRGKTLEIVRRPQARLNLVLLAVLFLTVVAKVALVYPTSINEKAFAESLPVGAVAFLKAEQYPGQMFNSYNWGGYLIWALPEYPVFIDGRTDLYNDEVIGEWLHVMRAEPGWEDILESHAVKLVLVERGSTLARTLEGETGWRQMYQDELSIVYIRVSG